MKYLYEKITAKKFKICFAALLLLVCITAHVNADSNIEEMTKKAEQGDAEAQFALAVMYYRGDGVPQNFINSYAWFKLAAAHGDEYATENIDSVASLLTPEQLAQAHALAAELQQKITDGHPPSVAADDLTWGTPVQFAIWSPIQIFPKDWNVYGFRANLFYGKNMDVYGVDLGLLANRADTLTGIQFAGAINRVSESLQGVQIAGVANNLFNGELTGIQIGFGNAVKNLKGIQMGCCAESTDSSTGIQIGGIFTKTNELKGLQFGFVNMSEKGIGLQLGICNIAAEISGLQIGLINVMTNGFLPVCPIINFSVSSKDDAHPAENSDTVEEPDAVKESGSP